MEPGVHSPADHVPPGAGVHIVQAGGHHAPHHCLTVVPDQPCQPRDTSSSIDTGLHHMGIFLLEMFHQPGTHIRFDCSAIMNVLRINNVIATLHVLP